MAPYFLHEMNGYGAWQAHERTWPRPIGPSSTYDELRATGRYVVLTPEELVEEQRDAPFPFVDAPPAVRRHADRPGLGEPAALRARRPARRPLTGLGAARPAHMAGAR